MLWSLHSAKNPQHPCTEGYINIRDGHEVIMKEIIPLLLLITCMLSSMVYFLKVFGLIRRYFFFCHSTFASFWPWLSCCWVLVQLSFYEVCQLQTKSQTWATKATIYPKPCSKSVWHWWPYQQLSSCWHSFQLQ